MAKQYCSNDRLLLGVLVLVGLSGCSTGHYLWQASKGQLGLIHHAKPLAEVIRDTRTSPRVRQLLQEVPSIKKFGETQGLKATANYDQYVDLKRDAVVWVVSGSPRLRLEARAWSFPVVGSFTYLGWFDRSDAVRFAEKLEQEEDIDVDVRGSPAYSTLGWFRDPILSTMLSEGEDARGDLVNVILHESVHATVYVSGQSYFNEALAEFVADRLTRVYLKEKASGTLSELKAYDDGERKSQQRLERFHRAYLELETLYASSVPDAEKTRQKNAIFQRLKDENGIKRAINNATIVQYRTYHGAEESFATLFSRCQEKWPAFWDFIRSLNAQSFKESQTQDFAPTLKAGCSPVPKA